MGAIKKKQHYVPQCYLEAWAIPNTHQIFVYDKKMSRDRKSNIIDVASENHFYDVNFPESIDAQVCENLGMSVEEVKEMLNSQPIENFFSSTVEGELSNILKKIIENVSHLTPWMKENCFFISEEDKLKLSAQLAYQHIRTKSVRNMLLESVDCLTQVLKDMNVPEKIIEEYKIDKNESKAIHAQLIFDGKELLSSMLRFSSFTWVLGVNRTSTDFITSDNPICTQAHIKDDFLCMSALMSKGVEIYYPISPRIGLFMFDNYHKSMKKYHKRYTEITKLETVEHYNSLCAIRSERCIFSSKNDFTIINTLNDFGVNITGPKTSVSWGGKIYHPSI